MNKDMYRLVWNSRLGAPQVVSEVAKSKTCGGSVTSSGPGKRTSSKRGIAAWPLALLTLGMASSAFAVSYNVTTGADAGAGSLRTQLAISGVVYVDPTVKTISLNSDIPGYDGPMAINASDALNITGGSLVGDAFSLSLNGASAQKTVSATLSGEFRGSGGVAPGGSASVGAAGTVGSPVASPGGIGGAGGNGGDGVYTPPGGSGSAAITGSNFKITNEADVYGGQGIASIAPNAGGAGGVGGGTGIQQGTGGVGGIGGAGASGGVGSAGGAGISATHFSVVNNALIQGGNGAAGVAGGNGGLGGQGTPVSPVNTVVMAGVVAMPVMAVMVARVARVALASAA